MLENMFALGSKIRAYDFQPREEIGELYVEGIITDLSGGTYTITVTEDTCYPENPRESVYVPLHVYFGEWAGRVTEVAE
jgi:hypothetical protein